MKKLRHSKLPITLECADNLHINMLNAIHQHMIKPPYTGNPRTNTYGWDMWIDEYGNWFDPFYKDPNQLELFDDV